MRRTPPAWVFAALALALFIAPALVDACTCADYTTEEGFDHSDAVLIAELIDERRIASELGKVYTFEVVHTYKGPLQAGTRFEVVDDWEAAECGRSYSDKMGTLYLLFPGTPDGVSWSDNWCSKSIELDDASERIQEIEAYVPERAAPPELLRKTGRCAVTDEQPSPAWILVALAALARRRRSAQEN